RSLHDALPIFLPSFTLLSFLLSFFHSSFFYSFLLPLFFPFFTSFLSSFLLLMHKKIICTVLETPPSERSPPVHHSPTRSPPLGFSSTGPLLRSPRDTPGSVWTPPHRRSPPRP